MSGTIDNTPDNTPPNNNDTNVLNTIFGRSSCANDTVTKLMWYFALAVVATVIYLILTSTTVGNYLKGATGAGAIWIGAIIFFLLILGLDYLITQWRLSHPLCK